MKHEDLIKKLENTTFTEGALESHKRRLKAVLMPTAQKDIFYSRLKNIFHGHWLFLKRVLLLVHS